MDFLIAILGGLILNVMPCVLPVLAVKMHSLLYSKSSGLLYTLGCITAFIIIGFLTKTYLGIWGIQMCNPYFLLGVGLLFFILGVGSFGYLPSFYITRAINSSFITGLTAPLVGSVCMAPMFAGAVGAAMRSDGLYSYLLFACMGFGMALPFLLLDFFPGIVKFIPKAGKWSYYLHRIIGCGLFLTSAWFFYLLWNTVCTI